MGRVILAAIVGAIVLFAWGFVAWPALHLYDFAFPRLNDEAAVVSAIKDSAPETGAYFFPSMPVEDASATEAEKTTAQEDWMNRHLEGPTGLLLYNANGSDPMDSMTFVKGIVINFIGAFFLALMMYGNKMGTVGGRFVFALFAIVFTLSSTYALNWNWFHLPDKYTMALMMDVAIGWSLAGLIISVIVKVRPPAA